MANVTGHRWLACAIVGLAFLLTGSVGFGQTFLDKLESVVRDKLNAPPTDQKTADQKAADQKAADSKSGAAELPAPNRPKSNRNSDSALGAPGNNTTGKIPSILENRPLVPAPQTEELQLAPSTDRPSTDKPSTDKIVDAEPSESAGVYLGLEVEELVGGGIGVRVSGLSDKSPAWKAGFKVGDLLQAIDGHAIADIDGMADRLRRVVPGKPTKFLVKRGGRNMELVAVLQNAALASRLGASPGLAGQVDGPVSGPAFLGVQASGLSPAFRSQFGLSVYSGAAVTSVAQGSPAHRAGIQPGDAIVEINGAPIDSGDDLMRWMAGAQIGQPAELMIYRGTQPSTVSVVLSGDPNNSAIMDRARTSARPPVGGTTARPATSLQVEVEQLRAELEQTQQQLLQTQRRLEQVLQQIEQNR